MKKLYYKVPKNKKEAVKFVHLLDYECEKSFKIKNKRERCKAIMKIHRTALDCHEHLKSLKDNDGLLKAISILEIWLKRRKFSNV
jgi:hypothetical protein